MTNIFLFMAISALPFRTYQALFFSAPLFITALSAVLLKETVGWQRWAAVLVGFMGVLIVVRPDNASFEIATLFALTAALLYALSVIATRKMEDSGAVTTVYTRGISLIGALILSPLFAMIETSSAHASIRFLTHTWYAMRPRVVAIVALLAIMWGIGMFLLSTAYQTTSVATLAPIEYSAVVNSILMGFMFWQEIPTMQMLAGLGLIVGSGLLMYGPDWDDRGCVSCSFWADTVLFIRQINHAMPPLLGYLHRVVCLPHLVLRLYTDLALPI